ncbi:hypothetical protein L2E82_32065 [Cichorium intybus]|uniref:Uncharacterized protein n=1 Tax=Cichorium intybus TaxID=13427 RepID=A0ACB9BG73_CICIN|nr:hypothetical protein L2E82_32065 [Cichorium intybus]
MIGKSTKVEILSVMKDRTTMRDDKEMDLVAHSGGGMRLGPGAKLGWIGIQLEIHFMSMEACCCEREWGGSRVEDSNMYPCSYLLYNIISLHEYKYYSSRVIQVKSTTDA